MSFGFYESENTKLKFCLLLEELLKIPQLISNGGMLSLIINHKIQNAIINQIN